MYSLTPHIVGPEVKLLTSSDGDIEVIVEWQSGIMKWTKGISNGTRIWQEIHHKDTENSLDSASSARKGSSFTESPIFTMPQHISPLGHKVRDEVRVHPDRTAQFWSTSMSGGTVSSQEDTPARPPSTESTSYQPENIEELIDLDPSKALKIAKALRLTTPDIRGREPNKTQTKELRAALVKHFFVDNIKQATHHTPSWDRSYESSFAPMMNVYHEQKAQWIQLVLYKVDQVLLDRITSTPEWDEIIQSADVRSFWLLVERVYIQGCFNPRSQGSRWRIRFACFTRRRGRSNQKFFQTGR